MHANDQSPDLAGPLSGNLPQQMTPVEILRAMMLAAPNYQDDLAQGDRLQTHYRAGSYDPTGVRGGLYIAEEIIPEQELVDSSNHRQYDFGSKLLGDFMAANSLGCLFDTNLAPALAGLGFTGSQLVTDTRGSRLLAASYPSPQQYTERLRRAGNDAVTIEQYDQYPAPKERVMAMSDGVLLTGAAPDMLMNGAIPGLVSPSVHRLLRAKAQYALGNHDRNLSALSRSQGDEIRHVGIALVGLNAVIWGQRLIEAVTDPHQGRVTPTGLQSLGFELRRIVERPDYQLEDHGLRLAEETIEFMGKLASTAS